MMWAYLTSHTWGRKDRTLSRGRSETTGVKTSGDCPAAEDPVKGSTHECKQPSPTFLPPSEVQARLWRTAAVSLNTSLPFTALWTAIKVSSIHPRAWGSLRPPLRSSRTPWQPLPLRPLLTDSQILILQSKLLSKSSKHLLITDAPLWPLCSFNSLMLIRQNKQIWIKTISLLIDKSNNKDSVFQLLKREDILRFLCHLCVISFFNSVYWHFGC